MLQSSNHNGAQGARVPALTGVRELAQSHPAWLCDVWGVIHDGVKAFAPAVDALVRFREHGGCVVLITNAPRPAGSVVAQLRAFSVSPDAWDAIVTSGDVTCALLGESPHERVFHLGPPRDDEFFDGLDIRRVGLEDATAVVCTGLIDDEAEAPEEYVSVLTGYRERGLPFYCANPDLVVQRGDRLVPCAGALAKLYGEMGGEVIIAGKPHAPIYEACLRKFAARLDVPEDRKGVLAIGDGIVTDVEGAARQGIDALFISGGIHGSEMGDGVPAFQEVENCSVVATMPRLVW